MKQSLSFLVAASALSMTVSGTAHAEKSDRVFVERMRGDIIAARSDAQVAIHGDAELDRAELALRDLTRVMDDNERVAAASITAEIDTLIATARIKAQIARQEAALASATRVQPQASRPKAQFRPASMARKAPRAASRYGCRT